MKNALILHAMEQNSQGHWYPWLKKYLEDKGYKVWVPDLPNTNLPNNEAAKEMLLSGDFEFNGSLIIGHSSGAMQALYLLQNLPEGNKVEAAVIVSSFDHPLSGMEAGHAGLFEKPYDFVKIKQNANKIIFVHSDNDPWCPLEGASNLSQQANAELVIVPGGGHFSTSLDLKYKEFPELVELLEKRSVI